MQPPVSFSTPDVWIIIGSAARPFGPYLAFGSPRRCPLRTRIPPRNAVHGRHRVRHPRGVQRRRPNSTGASIHPSRSQPARPQGRAVDAASASGRSLLATAAPRFCPSLPAGSAPALVAQKQIELPAATGKRQGGLDGTRPAGGEGELGVDEWIRRILRAARGLDRARVFPPLAPNPNHRVATCRHRATTCRQDQAARFRFRIGRGLPARARRCRRPAAQAERTTPWRREPCPHRMITNGETRRPGRKKMPNLSLLSGLESHRKPLLKRDNLGWRTHAHPISTGRESKAGAGLEQIIPPAHRAMY